MPRLVCVGCGAEFPCAPSFRGRSPKCSGCRRATQGRERDATAEARSAPQNGAAGEPQLRHMTPCACHCAACRAAGHGDGACVLLCAGLHALFDGKADAVDLCLRHYYGACGWDTARFDAEIWCVQFGPAGDVIAAGSEDGRIHFICAQTGEKILCPLSCDSAVLSIDWHDQRITAGCRDGTIKVFDAQSGDCLSTVSCDSPVLSIDWHANRIVAGCYDGTIKVFDAQSGDRLSTVNVGYAFSRCSTRISLPARPLFSRFSTRISV